MADLSPASRAVLVQIVSGGRVDHVPAQLVELKLVGPERLTRIDGMVALVWKATREGRKVAAMEDGE